MAAKKNEETTPEKNVEAKAPEAKVARAGRPLRDKVEALDEKAKLKLGQELRRGFQEVADASLACHAALKLEQGLGLGG